MTEMSKDPKINDLHNSLEDGIVKGMLADGTLEKGWEYQDHPKMLEKYWMYFLKAYGEEGKDYQKITEAKYEYSDGVYMRGQLLLGPNARSNLAEYRKNNPIPE